MNGGKAWVLAASVACLTAVAVPASAHRLPPQVVTFVKADASRARVLVRVPTVMLGDARLPMVETVYLDLRAIDGRLRSVAAEVARNLDVTDAGQPLAPSAVSWRVSLLTDPSFESFELAESHLRQPPVPIDRFIYWNEAFADFQFDYALSSAMPRLSARVNGLRAGGESLQTRLTYVPAVGRPRTMTVTGPPQRVAFEPSLAAALDGMARLGATELASGPLLLFILCLAIPQRPLKLAMQALTALLLAHLPAVVLVTWWPAAPDPSIQWLAQVAAAALLIVAALQNIAASGPQATRAISALFGACHGVTLGLAARVSLPLAGSHALAGVTATLLVVAFGAGWLLITAQPLLRTAFRLGLPAWLPLVALSAIPAHQGSHAMFEAARQLADLETLGFSPRAVDLIVDHWPVLALAGALTALGLVALTARRAGARWLPPDGHATP